MKIRRHFHCFHGAAIFAALWLSWGGLRASSKPALPPLTQADDRVQRLFDQAVKLHRRYAGMTKFPQEPLKSILMEISIYHEGEEATYLSDLGVDDKRSGPIPIAPWAQEQMALLDMQQKDYGNALEDYQDLGERFTGRKVIEPADGATSSIQAAELVATDGIIRASLEVARKAETHDVVKSLGDWIEALQQKFGDQPIPCADVSCGTYRQQALSYLWQALELDQATFKDWTKATLSFVKRDTSKNFQAAVLVALADGDTKLGKLEDAKENYERVMNDFPDAMMTDPSNGQITDFGIDAARRRLEMARTDGKKVTAYEARLDLVHQAGIKALTLARSPQVKDEDFQNELTMLQNQVDKPLDEGAYGIPQGIFKNLIQP